MIECDPTLSLDVEKRVTGPEPRSTALPSTVDPSWKVTVPPADIPPVVTAVKVTLEPTVAGLGLAVRVVAVVQWAAFTVSFHTGDVLPAFLVSPPYTAVIE